MEMVMLRAAACLAALVAVTSAVHAQPRLPGSVPVAPPPGVPAPSPGTPAPPQPGEMQPPPTGIQLSIPIAGEWIGEGGMPGAPSVRFVEILKADSTYNEWISFANGLIEQDWGTYAIQATSPTTAFINITPVGWRCSNGSCVTRFTPVTEMLVVVDTRTVILSQGPNRVRLVRQE